MIGQRFSLGGGSVKSNNNNIAGPIKLVYRSGAGPGGRISDISSKKSTGGGSALASGNASGVHRVKRSQITEHKAKSLNSTSKHS